MGQSIHGDNIHEVEDALIHADKYLGFFCLKYVINSLITLEVTALNPWSFLVASWSYEFVNTSSVAAENQDIFSFVFINEHGCHRESVLTTVY